MNQPNVGFSDEPLVFGMERIVNSFLVRLNLRQTRLKLALSTTGSADSSGVLIRGDEDAGGYWYVSEIDNEKGWLGLDGLELMFKDAPKRIFYRLETDDGGVVRSS